MTILVTAILVHFAVGNTVQQTAASQAPAPPGRFVDLGGHRLHAIIQGSGAPTVILESGNSAFSVDWALVQAKVAKFARVVSYDRAGYAWSDAAPFRGMVQGTVDDLHLMLLKSGFRPPYILVGASIGGIYTRAYQRRFPTEVAGLVLDDPTSDTGLSYAVEGKDKNITDMSAAEMRKAFERLFNNPPKFPTAEKIEEPFDRLPPKFQADHLWASNKFWADDDLHADLACAESWRQEFIALRRERLAKRHALGSLPLIVLGRHQDDEKQRQRDLKEMATLSSEGKLVIAEHSGHEIHLYRPELVVNAIREVIGRAKKHGL